VSRIESDLRAPHAADWTEKATELENDEVLEHLDAARPPGKLRQSGRRSAASTTARTAGARRAGPPSTRAGSRRCPRRRPAWRAPS